MSNRTSVSTAVITAVVLLVAAATAGASDWTLAPDFNASSDHTPQSRPLAVTAHGTAVTTVRSTALTLSAGGRVVKSRRLPIDVPWAVAAFGSDNAVFAGTVYAWKGPLLLATSRPGVALGSASSGTLRFTMLPVKGQFVARVAGNRRGDVAILTAEAGDFDFVNGSSIIWLRSASSTHFRRVLTLPRIDDLALGARGDLLMMSTVNFKNRRGDIVARYRTPAGTWQPQQKLGTGTYPRFQASIDRQGRKLVAWHDGDTTAFTSAAARGRFAPATVLTKSDLLLVDYEIGNEVTGRPFVRITAASNDRSLIAWTDVVDDRYRVREANVVDGRLEAPQDVTPAGQQAVLEDAAIAASGAALMLSHSIEPSTGLTASLRPSAATPFSAPEQVPPRESFFGNSSKSAFAAMAPDGATAYASFRGALATHRRP